MNIKINYPDKIIRYVKENNIFEEVNKFISLEACLNILESKKNGCVYTGNRNIDIILSISNEEDTYTINVDDVYMNLMIK